jgi:SAM-dependent methyltransferase
VRGRGVEVGAGIDPVLHEHVEQTWYVDKRCHSDLVAWFGRELPYTLSTWEEVRSRAACGVDFVVSHHVLEHAHDPIGAASEWVSHLRPGGVLCFSIPAPDNPTERGRPLTPMRHLLEDHFFARAPNSYDSMAHLPTFVMALVFGEDCLRPSFTKGTCEEMSATLLGLLDQAEPDFHWHTLDLDTAKEVGDAAFFLAGASAELLMAREGADYSLYLAWSKGPPGPPPSAIRDFSRDIDNVEARIRSLRSAATTSE